MNQATVHFLRWPAYTGKQGFPDQKKRVYPMMTCRLVAACVLLVACDSYSISPDCDPQGGGGGEGGSTSEPTRIQAMQIVGTDGSVIPSKSVWDDVIKAKCEWKIASDGEFRCLPGRAFEEGHFSDNVCTLRAAAVTACGEATNGWPRFVTMLRKNEACNGGDETEVWAVDAIPHTAYHFVDGECVQDTKLVAFTVVNRIDPDFFVGGQEHPIAQ